MIFFIVLGTPYMYVYNSIHYRHLFTILLHVSMVILVEILRNSNQYVI